MLKLRTLFFLGIWVAVLPFLGFPAFWKNVFFILSGALLLIVSYLLYKEKTRNSPKQNQAYQSFSEARPENYTKKFHNEVVKTHNEEAFVAHDEINEIKEKIYERRKISRPARIHATKESGAMSSIDNMDINQGMTNTPYES